MRFRTTLIDPDGNQKVLAEPEGLKGVIVSLNRHPELSSLIKEFKTSLRLYGSNGTQDGGRDWLKNVETVHGPDAVIQERIEIAEDNYTFEVFSLSEVGIQTLVEDNGYALDHAVEYTAVQLGFWRKAMSRFDVPVDIQSPLNLDGVAVDVIPATNLKLPSQVLNKVTSYTGHSGDFNTASDCIVATTANITLSGLQTIDGQFGFVGRRVLVKNQTDQTENGIYLEDSGSWTRAADANTDAELEGMIVYVLEGDTNAEKAFKQQTDPVNIGSSNIVFSEYNYVDDYLIFSDEVIAGITFNIYFPATVFLEQNQIESSFDVFHVVEFDPDDLFPQIELSTSDSGSIKFDWDINYSYRASKDGEANDMDAEIELFYQINDETPVLIGTDSGSSDGSDIILAGIFTGSITFMDGPDERVFNNGDRIKLYIKFQIHVDDEEAGFPEIFFYGGIVNQNVTFSFKSLYPDSTIKAKLVHDVIASVLDRITDSGKFYSALLGSPQTLARQYAESGCYWPNMMAKGLHIRGYSLEEKQFSISMKEIWEGLNPHLNLSMGYETIDNVNVIRLEEKSYHYDDSQMSVLLSGVQKIKRKYSDQYYNSVETGMQKGLIEDTSGIDDPYRQVRASIFKNIGRKLTILSIFITQSLTWEQARRTVRTKSSDFKYDNDTFMVEVINEGDGYKPKIDQDYDSVTGLLNEETRYNKRWTPARMFLRWSNVIFSGCQNYLGTVYRFVSGEGNYDMTSERKPDDCSDNYDGEVLAENSDITVTTNRLYIPIEYEFEHYLTIDEFKTIESMKRFAIGISQFSTDHKAFFITSLQHEIMSGQVKGTGFFKDPFDIITVPPGGQIFQGGKIFDATFDYSFE